MQGAFFLCKIRSVRIQNIRWRFNSYDQNCSLVCGLTPSSVTTSASVIYFFSGDIDPRNAHQYRKWKYRKTIVNYGYFLRCNHINGKDTINSKQFQVVYFQCFSSRPFNDTLQALCGKERQPCHIITQSFQIFIIKLRTTLQQTENFIIWISFVFYNLHKLFMAKQVKFTTVRLLAAKLT